MIQVVSLAEVSNAQAAEWLVDLAEDLRQCDLDEISATTREDPAVALMSCAMVSDHGWVILDGDDPIAAFGCAPTSDPSAASVWMLGSPRMDEPRNALGILRQSEHYKSVMHRSYPTLFNYIDARNEKSMRWLKWCGYELLTLVPEYGLEGRPFYLFSRHRPHSV